jgi:hypothetical protein
MQTVSKYGAADAEAQAPAAPEEKPLGRAKVALICVAAALSGAAVASVARVRTRTYAAELFGGVGYHMGGKNLQPPPTTLKKPCYLEDDCSETETCYVKLKDDGTTKHKCAVKGTLGSNWIIIESVRSKKKPGADSLSGDILTCSPDSKAKAKEGWMCATIYDPVCGEDGQEYSSGCNACMQMKAGNDKYTMGGC